MSVLAEVPQQTTFMCGLPLVVAPLFISCVWMATLLIAAFVIEHTIIVAVASMFLAPLVLSLLWRQNRVLLTLNWLLQCLFLGLMLPAIALFIWAIKEMALPQQVCTPAVNVAGCVLTWKLIMYVAGAIATVLGIPF